MTRVLVTGAGGSAAANFVDSLRRSGEDYFIVGADANPYMLELAPQIDARELIPRADEHGWFAHVQSICEQYSIDVVHAQPDQEVLKFSIAQGFGLMPARSYFPRALTVEICQDKARAMGAWDRAGVPYPASRGGCTADEWYRAADTLLDAHARAWVRARRGAGSRAALPVSTPEQAVNWVRWWVEEKGLAWDDLMISEFLPGREYAWQSVWWEGCLVTSAARERVEYLFGNLSPSGQSSSPSVAKTVNDHAVNLVAERAVLAIDQRATGVFCVDMKCDANGVPCVTEINAGRFFTTSNFFACIGANMPHAYVQLALGRDPGPLARRDAVPEGVHWIRGMDMGYGIYDDRGA